MAPLSRVNGIVVASFDEALLPFTPRVRDGEEKPYNQTNAIGIRVLRTLDPLLLHWRDRQWSRWQGESQGSTLDGIIICSYARHPRPTFLRQPPSANLRCCIVPLYFHVGLRVGRKGTVRPSLDRNVSLLIGSR